MMGDRWRASANKSKAHAAPLFRDAGVAIRQSDRRIHKPRNRWRRPTMRESSRREHLLLRIGNVVPAWHFLLCTPR